MVLTVPTASGRTRTASIYSDLMRQVKAAGLLERRTGHYLTRIAITAALLAGGWLLFVWLGNSWWQLFIAAFMAFLFTQMGFIGHDAGHRQIFRSNRANYVVGLVHGNLAIGLSYGWWVDKHNRHHAHPNHEGLDPDVGIGALAFSAGQAQRKRGVTRFITRHQGYLFLPLLLLESADSRQHPPGSVPSKDPLLQIPGPVREGA